MPTKVCSEKTKRQGLFDGMRIGGNVTLELVLKKHVAFVDWIRVNRNGYQWWDLVNGVMNRGIL
jgi:hypothetical protein